MAERVLVFVPSDRVGGAEQVLKIVATEALSRGVHVDVVCWTAGTRRLLEGFDHPNLSKTILVEAREWRGMIAGIFHFAVKKRRPRYAFAFSSQVHCNAYLALLRMTRLIRVRRLVCRESTIIPRRFSGSRRLFYRACYLFYPRQIDRLICQTNDMRGALIEFAPWLDPRRLCVIPNPIARRITSRREARNTPSSPLIVSVGRLIPEKGYADLIRSVPYILESWPEAKVDIYGEGPLKQELVDLIRAMDLNGSVRLCGFTSDPIAAMRAADVCVVCSVQEGFPNTLLEMMQSNTRVVSTLCADGIDRIAGLETCVPNDPAQLARAIKNALEAHNGDRARLFDLELARRSPSAFYDAIAAV